MSSAAHLRTDGRRGGSHQREEEDEVQVFHNVMKDYRATGELCVKGV